MASIKHLDCTLTDGGYYNNWDFDEELIKDYLEALNTSGVDIVKLGYRSLLAQSFKGACTYTTDRFLERLIDSRKFKISVMVNAGELAQTGNENTESYLRKLFNPAADSLVDIVRVACDKKHLPVGAKACQ